MARLFQNGAIPGSQSLPLYKPISGYGPVANIRRAAFAFFGVYGSELNKHWLDQVRAVMPQGSEVIVACGLGGDLQSKAGASTGFQSQSLKAAYQLRKAGWPKVYYIKGGIGAYARAVGPLSLPN